ERPPRLPLRPQDQRSDGTRRTCRDSLPLGEPAVHHLSDAHHSRRKEQGALRRDCAADAEAPAERAVRGDRRRGSPGSAASAGSDHTGRQAVSAVVIVNFSTTTCGYGTGVVSGISGPSKLDREGCEILTNR